MRRGFTLLEVVAALAILGLVLLFTFSVLGATGSSSVNARNAVLLEQAQRYLEAELRRGNPALAPTGGQSIQVGYNQSLQNLIPLRLPEGTLRLKVDNQGSQTISDVEFLRYSAEICIRNSGQEFCRQKGYLLPPPTQAINNISMGQPFEVEVACPVAMTPQVTLRESAGGEIAISSCGATQVPSGNYTLNARKVVLDGIGYEPLVRTQPNKVLVRYLATSGALVINLEYPTSLPNGERKGAVRFNGQTYTLANNTVEEVLPGRYSLTSVPFTATVDGLEYAYQAPSPIVVDIEPGQKSSITVSYQTQDAYFALIPAGGASATQYTFRLEKNSVLHRNITPANNPVEKFLISDQLTLTPLDGPAELGIRLANGTPRRVRVARGQPGQTPDCNSVLSTGMVGPQTLPLTGGQVNRFYWCDYPSYARLNHSIASNMQAELLGPAIPPESNDFRRSLTGSNTVWLPAVQGRRQPYSALALTSQPGVYPRTTPNPPNLEVEPEQTYNLSISGTSGEPGKYLWYFQSRWGTVAVGSRADGEEITDYFPPPYPTDAMQIRANGSNVQGPSTHESALPNLNLLSLTYTGSSGVRYQSRGVESEAILAAGQVVNVPVVAKVLSVPYRVDLYGIHKTAEGAAALGRTRVQIGVGSWIVNNQTLDSLLQNPTTQGDGSVQKSRTLTGNLDCNTTSYCGTQLTVNVNFASANDALLCGAPQLSWSATFPSATATGSGWPRLGQAAGSTVLATNRYNDTIRDGQYPPYYALPHLILSLRCE